MGFVSIISFLENTIRMPEVEKEYWVLMDETEILGVFETLQECLLFVSSTQVRNAKVQRVKKYTDGTFRHQKILLAPEAGKFEFHSS